MTPLSRNGLTRKLRNLVGNYAKRFVKLIYSLKRSPERVPLFLCAASSILVIFFILYSIINEGHAQIIDWFEHGFGMIWYPGLGPYGITPFIFSTLYVGFGGAIIALALGLPCAIYLTEFANKRLRNVVKPALEMLTGFPSVVIGLVGFTLVCLALKISLGGDSGQSVLAAWLVLGVMTLPTIASVSEDALRSVPQDLKEASLALGATRWQTMIKVLLPVAAPGIMASFLLGLGSATGETMAVIWVIGNVFPSPPITLNPYVPSNVLTALIANRAQGDSTYGSPEWNSMFAAAFVLFLITAIMNLAVRMVMARRGKESGSVILTRRP
ncbi:MAG TPA: phosphate ABC transporter permease subunit PstC [Candidatus Acidoferrum sp.]|nr:phosphate ABC transporter permease subunit PstC [Candidatus Acidoferrum sp.]